MPLLLPDRWVGVHEGALLPYASLWLYVSLAPALQPDRPTLLAYARSAAMLAGAGLLIFWLVPTAVVADPAQWQDRPLLAFLKSRDGGSNAFPSLHVAFALHSAAFIGHALREVGAPRALQGANIAWALLIGWSAMATGQHVLIDVLGGLAAGAASVARWRCQTTVAAAAPGGS